MDDYTGFRNSFFGGFNRKDVSQYIERLAAERNALKAEAERCAKELNDCSAQNNVLALRLGEAQLIAVDAKERLSELEQQVQEGIRKTEETQKALDAAEQLACEAADTDKALRDERDAMAALLAAAEERAAGFAERIKTLEAELEAANARVDEAERTANSVRVTAIAEAINTLDSLGTQCGAAADEADRDSDRANSEFWKVTAAMDELSAKMREAELRFASLSDELKAQNEA